jgi:CRP/FNR family transcriptional regulator
MNSEQILLQTELFKDASPSILKIMAESGQIREISKSDTLFNEGDEGFYFFIVVEGSIKLIKNTIDGKEIMVRILKPFETFGEVIIFESNEYPVSAIALDETVLFAIHRQTILFNLSNTDFQRDFCSMLIRKLRYLADRVLYVSAYDVEERFFRFLSDHYGQMEEYEIDLTKKDIASSIGTIPETMSRLIARLKARNIITWDKNRLTVQKGYWDILSI